MAENDGERVLAIYRDGIATGYATFQEHAPSWPEWQADHLAQCRIVAERDGRLIGWAALAGVPNRCVYRGIAELSLYVAASERGARCILQRRNIVRTRFRYRLTCCKKFVPENLPLERS